MSGYPGPRGPQGGGRQIDAGRRAGGPAAIRIRAVELAGPVPSMFWFRDPDGNALLIVEVS
jgi:hypothetical protein